jgi:hypothetical protein
MAALSVVAFYSADLVVEFTNRHLIDTAKQGYRTSWQIVLHHLVTLTPYSTVTFSSACNRSAQNYLLWAALCECTTPFTNMHWILSKLSMRETSLFRFNLLASILSYVVFRIVPLPLVTASAIVHFNTQMEYGCHWSVAITAYLCLTVMFLLSTYWFRLMLRHWFEGSTTVKKQ